MYIIFTDILVGFFLINSIQWLLDSHSINLYKPNRFLICQILHVANFALVFVGYCISYVSQPWNYNVDCGIRAILTKYSNAKVGSPWLLLYTSYFRKNGYLKWVMKLILETQLSPCMHLFWLKPCLRGKSMLGIFQ